jgi:chromosome segregation ATPase
VTDDELKRLLEGQFAETRRHFDVVVERLEVRFQGMNEAIDGVDERLGRLEMRVDGIEERLDSVEETIIRESTETRAMIRLSYTELDRRLRSLEDRVDRLEQTIH